MAKRGHERTPKRTRVAKKRTSRLPNGGAQAVESVQPTDHAEKSRRGQAQPGTPLRPWGPDNPHPLSMMRTELVWEGKYDEWGNRREVDIAGCAMPMQRIETIDQPRSEAAAAGAQSLIQFEKKTTRLDDFRNRLIWGDNKLVMASLLAEFKGTIDLIYIDPPFNVDADFCFRVPIGDGDEQIEKDQSALEMVAYNDTWGKGTDSYLNVMTERIGLMRDLLAPTGSLVVHVDWRVSHWMRALLADIFGAENFVSEIVWKHQIMGGAHGRKLPKAHENLLWCAKSQEFRINIKGKYARVPFSDYVRDTMQQDADGKFFYTRRRMSRKASDAELAVKAHTRTYVEDPEAGTMCSDVWDDMPSYQPKPNVNTKYPTQKPDELLERVISAATLDPADGYAPLVADFFCGSGTTGAVAEKLGRRWIMADLGRFAIHTTRKRLIDVQRTLSAEGKPYRSFDVHNLGRYERQWWQQEALKGADDEHRRVVLEFFKAEILDPAKSSSPLIHGRKGRALCHVDGIDSIFDAAEARAVAQAAAGMGATEVYCLAWDFEMDIRQRMAAIEAQTGVKLYPIKIPREIMERNRTSPPPWLEVAVLEAEPVYRTPPKGSTDEPTRVDIKLTKFLPSLADVPTKELESIRERAIKSGFDFIDFWAIDFDWHTDKPFNHHWQDYRTRKDRSLETVSSAGHAYAKSGKYTACVKVVDVFGCDTSITVPVKV